MRGFVRPLGLLIAMVCTPWLLPATTAAAARIDPDNPPKGTFADDWYSLELRGHKAGHMHVTVTRRHDAKTQQDVVETVTSMEMAIKRDEFEITIGTEERSVETIDGQIVRFGSETDMSLIQMQMEGTYHDGNVTIKTTQLGQTVTKTYPLPAGACLAWGAYRLEQAQPLKVGTHFTLPSYAPAMSPASLTPTEFRVVGKERIDLYGRVVDAYKTEQTMQAKTLAGQTEIKSEAWVDENWMPLRIEMELMEQPIRLIYCTKEIALQPADPPEFMAQTLISVKMPAGASNASVIRYRIAPRKPDTSPLGQIPDTDMQQAVKQNDGSYLLTVYRGGCPGKKAITSRPTREELDALRQASSYANSDDPQIKRLAARAAGDEKEPHALVRKLRAFVSDYIQNKDLGVGFATASEVARSRQGDCSEHAVLLAALARASGFPARAVSGIVYAPAFGGSRNVFVWHMWTQVWLDGRWVDTDAALGQDVVDATHIALSIMPLTEGGLGDVAFPIWNLVGNLDISVVDLKR